jgi:DNA polymerase III epsilon subunit-like protein
MLADAPKFSEKAEELKALIESHDEVIAHNATFDMTMVDNEMKRCGLTVNWPTVICTVEATEFMKGHRLKLANLHELLFGEVFLGAHRAENDVRALARCLLQLRAMGVV